MPASPTIAQPHLTHVAGSTWQKHRRTILMTLAPALVIIAGGWAYLTSGRYEETDNAYVTANLVNISPQVGGRIIEATAHENQPVKAGDILFRIDPAPYQVALDQAEAQLAQARAAVDAEKATYRAKQQEITLDQDTVTYTQREFKRQQALAKNSYASQSNLDTARHNYKVAQQTLAIAQEDLAKLAADLGGSVDTPTDQTPQVKAALAARNQAALNLNYTAVTAPFDGTVTQTPQPGQYAEPGTPVVVFVASNDLWVEANLKETQLTHVQPGQPVKVWVDTYPDHVWQGTVASVSGATGSQTSVLPAQNATGNWVKVVQRIPVRVHIPNNVQGMPLRDGMSVQVEIDTGAGHTPLGRLWHTL